MTPHPDDNDHLDFASLAADDAPITKWASDEEQQAYVRAERDGTILQHCGTTGLDMSDEPYDFSFLDTPQAKEVDRTETD